MSMSYTVFSNRHLASVGEWQKSLDELGFDLRFDPEADGPVVELNGHLPATWNGQESGFECSPGGADRTADAVETYEAFDFGGPWTCIIDLYYWGYAGCAGAMMAAAAYARATGGVVFESEGGDVLQPDAAVDYARETEAEMKAILAADQP